ncbi:MAG: glycosyltransferase, partial [Candidatus Limisoma sp.]
GIEVQTCLLVSVRVEGEGRRVRGGQAGRAGVDRRLRSCGVDGEASERGALVGVADLVDEGVNGYKIDVSEIERITNKIDEILTDRELYVALSGEALRRSRQFSEQSMIESIKK